MIPKIKMNTAEFEALRAKMGAHVDAQNKAFYESPLQFAVAKARTAVSRGPWQARHKYNATRTEVDGVKFTSKAEAAYYQWLRREQACGRLVFFLRQTAIHIPGSRYVLDFLEFWADGRILWSDVKGFCTQEFKIKMRAVEAIYPFKIQLVKMTKRGPVFGGGK